MYSGTDWMTDTTKAETFSPRMGEICTAIPLYGASEPDDRTGLAVAQFRLAMEHHSSIHLLFRHAKVASANALARPLFEAAFRSIWVATKARPDEISRILKGGKAPLLGKLIRAISRKPSDPLMTGEHQAVFHCFTHGGTRALNAFILEGEARERATAVVTAQAGMSLAYAGITIAQLLDHPEFVKQLTEGTEPIVDLAAG